MRRVLLVVTLWGLGWGCSPGEDGPAQATWEAGDLLLQGPIRLFSDVGSELPPSSAAPGPQELLVSVGPDEWRRAGEPSDALAGLLSLPPDASLWEALPVARLFLGGSRPVLELQQHELPGMHVAGFPNLWRDEQSGLLFWWRREQGLLLALGNRRPGATSLRSRAELEADDEPGAASGKAPAGAGSATEETLGDSPGAAPVAARAATDGTPHAPPAPVRYEVGNVSRPALLLPAPSRLRFPARTIQALSLRLALHVPARGTWRADDGRLMQRPLRGLALAVSVSALSGGQRTELLSQVIPADEPAFRQLVVDTSSLLGRSVALELSARPLRDTGEATPFVAWADGLFGGAPPGQPAARASRPHVVLISLDTLRADRLGCTGCARDTSPGLDAWAARSAVIYDDVLSDSNWTLPSTASLITGLSTHQHGVLAFPAALGEATPSLAARLRDAGWDTSAITEGGFVSPAFGFDRGFARFERQPAQHSDWSGALQRLAERGEDRPQFLFLHTYGVHAPWAPDPHFADPDHPYQGPLAGVPIDDGLIGVLRRGEIAAGPAERAELNRRYDAAVRRLDDKLSGFLRQLDDLVDPGERLVILTSDHGEHLFEHGFLTHGHSLYGSVLSVPLLVSWPGNSPLGRSATPVSGLDVVPTVLDLLGLEIPSWLPGRSLRGDPDPHALRVSQHADSVHAVQRDGWKLITARFDARGKPGPGVELFHLSDDPQELHDLSTTEARRVEQLQAALARWLEQYPPLGEGAADQGDLGADDVAALKQLGYLGDR